MAFLASSWIPLQAGTDYWQVDELDLSKVKATELLKAHEGDATKAIRAFISPPVRA
jgi:hypothetical protein